MHINEHLNWDNKTDVNMPYYSHRANLHP